MPQYIINTGNVANDGTGQTLRSAFVQVNANFTELYGNIAGQVENSANSIVQRDPSGNIAVSKITFHNGFDTSNAFPVSSSNITGMVAYSVSDDAEYYNNGNAWVKLLDVNHGNTAITGNLTVSANITAGNINVTGGNINGNVAGHPVGYSVIPQIASGNITIAASDTGKHYYSTTSGTETITIPENTSVYIPVGSVFRIILRGLGLVVLAPQVGVNLVMAGSDSVGSRTVSNYGEATLTKIETNWWWVSGVNIS